MEAVLGTTRDASESLAACCGLALDVESRGVRGPRYEWKWSCEAWPHASQSASGRYCFHSAVKRVYS